MEDKELCAWLRENSSGVYRPAREAAGRIERLISQYGALQARYDALLDTANHNSKEGDRCRHELKELVVAVKNYVSMVDETDAAILEGNPIDIEVMKRTVSTRAALDLLITNK